MPQCSRKGFGPFQALPVAGFGLHHSGHPVGEQQTWAFPVVCRLGSQQTLLRASCLDGHSLFHHLVVVLPGGLVAPLCRPKIETEKLVTPATIVVNVEINRLPASRQRSEPHGDGVFGISGFYHNR